MIFEQYTYKVKFKFLICIFILLSFTAYKRSFKTLLEVITENDTLSKKTEQLKNKGSDINSLSKEIAVIDRIIGGENKDAEKIQQNIVGFIAKYNGISIYDLQSVHEFKDENFKVYTNQADVTGNINSLLKLSYDFEKKFTNSRLISTNYYTVKKNNLPTVLHLKMIFQNYENNN